MRLDREISQLCPRPWQVSIHTAYGHARAGGDGGNRNGFGAAFLKQASARLKDLLLRDPAARVPGVRKVGRCLAYRLGWASPPAGQGDSGANYAYRRSR